MPAQDSGPAAELVVPEITVTAEDPLILLPPLGPAPAASAVPLPPPAGARAAARQSPLTPAPRFAAVPPPAVVLRHARAPRAVERTNDLALSAALDPVGDPQAVGAGLRLATGAPGREAALEVAAVVSLRRERLGRERPERISVQGRLRVPGYQLGLDMTLADFLGQTQAAHAGLTARGAGEAALTFARWRRGSSASLAAQFGVGQLLAGLDLAVGGAVTLQAGAAYPLPAGRVTLTPAPDWRFEAGLRPYLRVPRWAANVVPRADDYLDLAPERAWLAWLGGNYRSLELRFGVAHGLIHRFHRRAVDRLPDDAVLLLLALEWEAALLRSRAGDLTLRVAAGAAGAWPAPAPRLLLDAAWPVLAEPSLAVLLQAGFLQAPLYGVEDWLASGSAGLGLAAAVGVRWAPVHGHQVQILGGIRESSTGLTLFAGIEYAHRVVRLAAPR